MDSCHTICIVLRCYMLLLKLKSLLHKLLFKMSIFKERKTEFMMDLVFDLVGKHRSQISHVIKSSHILL